ncbi:MAG: endonuclease/exonuclease/phosphatase family protein [Pseudomonadota bacterium]
MFGSNFIIISILTLNIWGLPGIGSFKLSPLRKERVQGICHELKRASQDPLGWDAVMLQEVWLPEDRRILSKCGYRSVVDLNDPFLPVDSGLLFLSKHPLRNGNRLTYPAIPLGADVLEDGEALARKSANVAVMMHPEAGEIWLANTHLVSYYAEANADQYQETRRNQFISFAKWARELAGVNPLILGGDWNFGSHNHEIWGEKNQILSGFVVSKASETETTLSADNSFQEKDQDRVDHIFASGHFASVGGQLEMHHPIEAQGKLVNLSDHFGWSETFSLSRP